MQREDFEHDICKTSTDIDGGKGQRSCDAEGPVTDALKARGYCWGGSFYTYLQYWLKCKDDPQLRPGYVDPTTQPLQPLSPPERPIMNSRFPISNYHEFPSSARQDMQRADYESEACNRSTYAYGERGMLHCVAMSIVQDRLKEKKWCPKDYSVWGSTNWKKC